MSQYNLDLKYSRCFCQILREALVTSFYRFVYHFHNASVTFEERYSVYSSQTLSFTWWVDYQDTRGYQIWIMEKCCPGVPKWPHPTLDPQICVRFTWNPVVCYFLVLKPFQKQSISKQKMGHFRSPIGITQSPKSRLVFHGDLCDQFH